MPALEPVDGVCRVSCRGTANGQSSVNVFHVQIDAGMPTVTALNTWLGLFRPIYETEFVPRLNGSYSGDFIQAIDLSSESGAEVQLALGGTPGALSPSVPQSAAVCITWKIDRHYRGGHPRTYLGPLNAVAIESPTSLAPAFVTQVQTAANSFLTRVNALTLAGLPTRLVCVHRQRNDVPLIPPLVSPIKSAVVDSRIDSQRRRLGRDR